MVVFETSIGKLTIGLYTAAPHTMQHIITLVEGDHYVGGSFYRVEPEYVIQAGRVCGFGSVDA
jgi:cyclophilin family peptidyl-prolyl cis-trans isomerase